MTLEEREKLWRQLAAAPGPLRLEDAYELAVEERGGDSESDNLSSHADDLFDGERHGDVVDVARAVLASGAEFPANWYSRLVDSLVLANRLDEAVEPMRAMIGLLESYSAHMLHAALRYHRARGDRDIEALLYHAGRRWVTSFSVTKREAKSYGKAPADLAPRFIAWLASWIEASHWTPATAADISHWLVWFDDIGVEHAGGRVAALEAERDRRRALFDRIKKARREDMRAIADEIMTFPGDPDYLTPVAIDIARDPAVAYDLLLHAVTSEGRTGYRYPTGERVLAVVHLTNHALRSLPEKLAEALAIAEGYIRVRNADLHYNITCCAARLGRKPEAIRHAARTLALGWKHPETLHDDKDLAALRGDPEFERVFTADAARRRRKAEKKAGRATKSPPKPRARPTGQVHHELVIAPPAEIDD